MSAYYNEFDPFAAAWLRELIKAGHIAPGDVDERSIDDVLPSDLRGYTQCHFFAGIGAWSYALRQAGWSDDRAVWTGSCPCQSFSAAGKGAGFADERHLWPSWFHLIKECKPDVIFGEQVEAAIKHSWLDLVQTDLENSNYAVASIVLPAAGFGAPHIRHRLYFAAGVAYSDGGNPSTEREQRGWEHGQQQEDGSPSGVADTELGSTERHGYQMGSTPGRVQTIKEERERLWAYLGDGREFNNGLDEFIPILSEELDRPSPTNGFWRDVDWIGCRDDKFRPVEPGSSPLANGITNRVGKLRGYGNALCAEVAKEFIASYMAATQEAA